MFLNTVSVIRDDLKGRSELGMRQRKSTSFVSHSYFWLFQLPADNFNIKKKEGGFGNQHKWAVSLFFNVKEKWELGSHLTHLFLTSFPRI